MFCFHAGEDAEKPKLFTLCRDAVNVKKLYFTAKHRDMKFSAACFFCALTLSALAQKREEIFDYSLRPNKQFPFYFVTTEKEDSGWHRKIYAISTALLSTDCFYKDEACTVPHGRYVSYDLKGFEKESGAYVNGKKEGPWLGFSDKGLIIDSGMYAAGRPKGVRMKWYEDGMPSDSLNFDGAGNGVQVSWYKDGSPSSAGFWTQDTLKKGRWKYYFNDGTVMATEDYAAGKFTVCNCYTQKGEALDTASCREKEAVPAGGLKGWQNFLEKSLFSIIDNLARRGAKAGNYIVLVRFLVTEDGTVTDIVPQTKLGQGIEEEVIAALRKAPRWQPGKQFGRAVKSYHTQPIAFSIVEQ